MPSKKVDVLATDGSTVSLVVPTDLPRPERAEYLRRLWTEHVRELDGSWKGRVLARVAPELADDMAEALEFMGALVDKREALPSGRVSLYSEGYWAHGF